MKKTFFLFSIIVISFIACSFYYLNKNKKNTSETNSTRDIVLQFITYNGYGNNLYLDNVLTGIRPVSDISVTSILNIPYDTTYSTLQSGTDTVSPMVTINNLGLNPVIDTNTYVYLEIVPGGYFDSIKVQSLGVAQSTVEKFKLLTYTIGTGYYFKAYTSYSADSNHTNDTLNQYSINLPGYQRNVLYEEFTSNSSPACLNNNSFLNTFVNRNIQTVSAIKYHIGFPNFIDTFYIQNPFQSDARRRYYYVSSVPTTFADGIAGVNIPYGDSTNLYNPYYANFKKGTPFSISVTDENVAADSIKTTIDINILSSVPQGEYKLRINAVERYVIDSLQGAKTNFYDVFRAFYPDSDGISIPVVKGSYQYQYTYFLQPDWNPPMMYTSAFIQNNNTREVMNSGKGAAGYIIVPTEISNRSTGKSARPDLLNVSYNYDNSPNKYKFNFSDSVQTSLNIELFEAFFPPLGWKIYNEDGFITFNQYSGANGPTFGGTKSVIMDFFDYNIPGQRDSMYSKVYRDLLIADTLRFDYAYAQYNSTDIDSLIVKISTDGGITFPVEIFRKGGLGLATAPQTTSFFIPSNNTQWKSYKFSLSSVVSVESNSNFVVTGYELKQNFPNPFNPKTEINYSLPLSAHVKLIVYDILGKEIQNLVDKNQTAGNYQVSFNAGNLASGIYFYKLSTEGFTDTKRMVLVK